MIRLDPAQPKGIVWLASYPKSGNTWLRAFLNALYNVLVGNSAEAFDLNAMDTLLLSDRDAPRFEKHLGRPVMEAPSKEIAALRPTVQEELAASVNGPVMVKTHNALIGDGDYPLINWDVTAGAVYVVRNPLDVAVSFSRFLGVTIDEMIDHMATESFGHDTIKEAVYYIASSWSENVESWTGDEDPTIHVVRYEDLLETPVEAFSAIATHVMMPHTRQQIEQAVEVTSFEQLRAAEQRAGYGDRSPSGEPFFREGRAGQWRDVLSDAQVQRMVDAHGEQMHRFGYLPSQRGSGGGIATPPS